MSHRLCCRAGVVAVLPLLAVLTWPGTAPASAAAEDLPERRITIHGTEPKQHVFGIRGRVEGAWAEKRVTVQRKNCRDCGWFAWRTVRTDTDKRYAARVRPSAEPGVVCYRAKVRATQRWAVSHSSQVCLVTRRL
ncbi:hypothetical protein [Nocardioides ferulae]|uniref:hypothetical protein n=1 Tax=Nocardioides ferulae TaxID=2340821 RepID=UPI000EB40D70|nr:hypothetical protein [Nocardioides ferulae]